ncbi:MAG TPA: hypothetical protein VFX30_11170 [bacterium]|nr:hypothetical protein [bacterium]
MKRINLLALVLVGLSLAGTAVGCGEKGEEAQIEDFFNQLADSDGSFGTYDDNGGSGGGDNDNFWSSDASDSAGNFDENGDGYVCVDGTCY